MTCSFLVCTVILSFFIVFVNGAINCFHNFRSNVPYYQSYCIYAVFDNETVLQACDFDTPERYGYPAWPNSKMNECVRAPGYLKFIRCDTDMCNDGCEITENSTIPRIEDIKEHANTTSVPSIIVTPTEVTNPSSTTTKRNLTSSGINCHHSYRSNVPKYQKHCIYAVFNNETTLRVCDYDTPERFGYPAWPNSKMNECVRAPGYSKFMRCDTDWCNDGCEITENSTTTKTEGIKEQASTTSVPSTNVTPTEVIKPSSNTTKRNLTSSRVNCRHSFHSNSRGRWNYCIYAQLDNGTDYRMCDLDTHHKLGLPKYPNSLMNECVKAPGYSKFMRCDTNWCNYECNITTKAVNVTTKQASTPSEASSIIATTETTKLSSATTKQNPKTLELTSSGINCHHSYRSNYPAIQNYCIYAQLDNQTHIQLCDLDFQFDLPPYPNSPMNECVKAPGYSKFMRCNTDWCNRECTITNTTM